MKLNAHLEDVTLGELIDQLESDPKFLNATVVKGYVHLFIKDHEYHGIILEKLTPDEVLIRLRAAQTTFGANVQVAGAINYGS